MSKAFWRSTKTPQGNDLLSKLLLISSTMHKAKIYWHKKNRTFHVWRHYSDNIYFMSFSCLMNIPTSPYNLKYWLKNIVLRRECFIRCRKQFINIPYNMAFITHRMDLAQKEKNKKCSFTQSINKMKLPYYIEAI